jgi:hypothetical protein
MTGQFLPPAPQQLALLFDHFVGAGEQHRRDFEPEGLRSRQIDHKFGTG